MTPQDTMRLALEWIEDAVVVLSHTSSAIQGGIGAEAEGVGGCSVQVIKALREALAQPVQEPVGEVLDERGAVDWISFVPPAGTPLYTSPPAQRKPWVGLTDEEAIFLIENESLGRGELIDAIEAKLREKNA